MRTPPRPSHSPLVDQRDWNGIFKMRQNGLPWESLVNSQGMTALHLAVLNASDAIVQRMLDWEAPVQAYQDFSGTQQVPLWDGIRRGRDTVCTALIQAGADLSLQHPEDGPLLLEAARQHLQKTTLALFQFGQALDALDEDEQEQFFKHWQSGKTESREDILKAILETKWAPDTKSLPRFERVLLQYAGPNAQRLLAHWRQVREAGLSSAPHSGQRKRA